MSAMRRTFRGARVWEWLARGVIAGLLLTVAACGRNESPQHARNDAPATPEITAPSANEIGKDSARLAAGGQASALRSIEAAAREAPAERAPAAVLDPIAQTGKPTPSAGPANRLSLAEDGKVGVLEFRSNRAQVPPDLGKWKEQFTKAGGLKRRAQARDGAQAAGGGAALKEGVGEGDKLDGFDTENYQPIVENPFHLVKQDPLSTFSAAVDTASYSNVRRFLNENQLPPKDSVRIADMLNYFNYDYAQPKNGDPVAFTLEIGSCPWQPKHYVLRIALKAKTIDKEQMPPRNLVFLIDTSGSMQAENRLPLVKRSLQLLVEQLHANDRVSIVTYAGNCNLALAPTPGDQKSAILQVIEALRAGGSTYGSGGIIAAYEQAKLSFIKEGVNRVILATDGDFNVGVSSDAELVRIIEEKRNSGVYLTVLGYGMGNLKDSKLEQLAHHGNGHYAYIDTLDEAKKVFVDQGGSLVTVAKDVKLQVEFNPAKVAAYRLVGYENRLLRAEDFRDDKKDAGDMGSGHTCTALYEVVPVGEKVETPEVEPLKYQTPAILSDAAKSGEFMTVRMRYKHPDTDKAQEVSAALPAKALGEDLSKDFQFAAAVAGFGMLLRDSEYKGNANYSNVLESAQGAVGEDKEGYRKEFVKLVRLALTIDQARQAPGGGAAPAGAPAGSERRP
jgi:Ca-activated chloride channel homolog